MLLLQQQHMVESAPLVREFRESPIELYYKAAMSAGIDTSISVTQYIYPYRIHFDRALSTVHRKQFDIIIRTAAEMWNKRVLCERNARLEIARKESKFDPEVNKKFNVKIMTTTVVSFQLGPYLNGMGTKVCPHVMNISANSVQAHSTHAGFIHFSSTAGNSLHPILLYYTALHEFGHVLGYDHINSQHVNIMNSNSHGLVVSIRNRQPPAASDVFTTDEVYQMRENARWTRSMIQSHRELKKGWITGMKCRGSPNEREDAAYVDDAMYASFYNKERTSFNRSAFVAESPIHSGMYDTYARMREHYTFSGRIENVPMLIDFLVGIRVRGFVNLFGSRNLLMVKLESNPRVISRGIVIFVVAGASSRLDGCYYTADATNRNHLWKADWTYVDDDGVPRIAQEASKSAWVFTEPLPLTGFNHLAPKHVSVLGKTPFTVHPKKKPEVPKPPRGRAFYSYCTEIPYILDDGKMYSTTGDGYIIDANSCYQQSNGYWRSTSVFSKLVHLCKFRSWPRVTDNVNTWNEWSTTGPDLSKMDKDVYHRSDALDESDSRRRMRLRSRPILATDEWQDMYHLVSGYHARNGNRTGKDVIVNLNAAAEETAAPQQPNEFDDDDDPYYIDYEGYTFPPAAQLGVEHISSTRSTTSTTTTTTTTTAATTTAVTKKKSKGKGRKKALQEEEEAFSHISAVLVSSLLAAIGACLGMKQCANGMNGYNKKFIKKANNNNNDKDKVNVQV